MFLVFVKIKMHKHMDSTEYDKESKHFIKITLIYSSFFCNFKTLTSFIL